MKHFKFYSKQDILSLTRLRRFETKLGERVLNIHNPLHLEIFLQETTARYVVIGIPEDIGVRANKGVAGTDTAWLPFLQAFLNTQSNDFLTGEDILLPGYFDFGDMQYLIDNNAHSEEEKLEAYRHAVNTIDDEVETIIKIITETKKFL